MNGPARRGDGRSIGEALASYLASRGIEPGGDLATVAACWREVVGDELAAHSVPLRLGHGELAVAVDHPSYRLVLDLDAPRLLEALAQVCGRPVAKVLKVTVRGSLGLESR